MARIKDFHLEEVLLKLGLVAPGELEDALREKAKTRKPLSEILIHRGLIDEHQLLELFSKELGIPYLRDLKHLSVPAEALERIPAKLAAHYHFLPIKISENKLTICVSNPADYHMLDEIRALVGYEIDVAVSDRENIGEAIKQHYGIGAAVLEKLSPDEDEIPRTVAVESTASHEGEASIIELVNQLLADALKSGASDIHLEPYRDALSVRYRIDGLLRPTKVPPQIKRFQTQIVSRIKIMAGLDIAEKRLPQDGRILFRSPLGELDLRISIISSPYGESVMIRLLRPHMIMDLEKIGFSADSLQRIKDTLKKQNGIVLVTGPTGSGKTTTLYAALNELNTPERKIITIEDPIEYEMKGILQMQVRPKISLTFAACLRFALRHDPDVMMVGEIRDPETAQIAGRAALTGHLVFSTLHTRDAVSAMTRLIDMGVEPYLVASTVEVVIAQRLIRTICPGCKHEVKDRKREFMSILPERFKNSPFFEGRGCPACQNAGYRGRIAIQEILVVDDDIRALVLKQVSAGTLRELALKKGLKTLWEDGIEKAVRGITTLEEVFRVVTPRSRTPV